MNMWRRVCRSAGSVRARSTVVAWAQQLFGAALVLVRRLSGQALSRIFPLGCSGEVTIAKTKQIQVKTFSQTKREQYNIKILYRWRRWRYPGVN